ncbi:unnamed protein product [Gulo gulo]|uniref:Uncharacterized protein n=1 Tax=Gulo gulo TaxID=48420 RepID=A0A9X9LUU5_GULGU|nr:unnamed protein product [Gulo gulo]
MTVNPYLIKLKILVNFVKLKGKSASFVKYFPSIIVSPAAALSKPYYLKW